MRAALEWIRTRSSWLLALAVVAIIGAFFGRLTAPERVRVEERERVVRRVEWREKLVEKRVEGPVRIRTVTREIPPSPGSPCPDRPLLETERIEERGPVVVNRAAESAERIVREVVKERIEVPAPLPQWRAGALVGFDLGALSLASPAGALVVGGHVERRVWGPLSLGAFALVPLARPLAPAVGASLSVEW